MTDFSLKFSTSYNSDDFMGLYMTDFSPKFSMSYNSDDFIGFI